MGASGFILLYRQITEWEWYHDPNTFRVFLHILLKANFTDGRFEGKVVKRGQLVTSLPQLSQQTKLSIQKIRTALSHLISTGEITDDANRQYRVITVVNYDKYQVDNRQDNRQPTDDQQTTNRQDGENQQQYKKNIKKREKGNNDIHHQNIFVPPTPEDVSYYCDQRCVFGLVDPEKFVDYYEARGWELNNGRKMKDWRAAVRLWERNEKSRQHERDLRDARDELPF